MADELPDNVGFYVAVHSQQGRHDVDVQREYQSDQPRKQLAELTVLEVGFLAWAREERVRLARMMSFAQA